MINRKPSMAKRLAINIALFSATTLLLSQPALALDKSSLSIGISNSNNIIHILVTDPLGRQTGVEEHTSGKKRLAIPSSDYDENNNKGVDDHDPTQGDVYNSEFMLDKPMNGGQYKIHVSGNGKFSVIVRVWNSDWSSQANVHFDGNVIPDSPKDFLFIFRNTPAIQGISPSTLSVMSGQAGKTLIQVTGFGFQGKGYDKNSLVAMDGQNIETSFVDANHLKAYVDNRLLATAGKHKITVMYGPPPSDQKQKPNASPPTIITVVQPNPFGQSR